MQGVFFLALAKRSRTRDGPTPTNISTNSDPDTEKNGTPDSPAVAFARSVLPVPGGPERIAPRGIFAPRAWNFPGFFKKETNSIISILASSMPATSANLTLMSVSELNRLARDLPMPNMPLWPPAPDAARRDSQKRAPTKRMVGPKEKNAADRGTSSEYATGILSELGMPNSWCASSNLRSNASTERRED